MFGQRRGDGRGGEVEKTSLQVASDLVVGRRVGKVHFEFMFVCSDGFVCDIMVPHMFSGTVFARHPAPFFLLPVGSRNPFRDMGVVSDARVFGGATRKVSF